jgi:hypothetical protein
MYLNIDYTGPASGQELGKKGDEVQLVEFKGWNTMVLVERNGKRAWLWPEDLSTEKPINESETDRPKPTGDSKEVKANTRGQRSRYKRVR